MRQEAIGGAAVEARTNLDFNWALRAWGLCTALQDADEISSGRG